jgi:flagellar biosynthesis chaperone FliJ
MSYEKLIPLLTKAIQEQQAMIEELQKKVEQLENKLTIEY